MVAGAESASEPLNAPVRIAPVPVPTFVSVRFVSDCAPANAPVSVEEAPLTISVPTNVFNRVMFAKALVAFTVRAVAKLETV